ncbi:hypothetical protein ABGB18_35080 [Nonomuraea sp. B12E4]|uniref:hypothetical protein n=1 Tax=Nonomuraea sp. B12E4 TaxID=3153564 RepID=UPI00325E6DC7
MRYAWLCHPVTIAGVVVLLVNDHLLKQAWPGFVTGRLSDAAGLVVAPALLALLCLRRADLAATVLTGVLFTLAKTAQTGAEAASHIWTSVAGPSALLADPTALLALPALALAWWVRGRTLATSHSRTLAASQGRTGPRSRRWAWASPGSRRRIILTVPLAVLAVTAASAAEPPVAHSVEADGIGAGLRRFQQVYTGFAAAACLGFLAGTGDADWEFLDIDVTRGMNLLGVLATMAGTMVCLVLAFAGRARPVTVTVSAGAALLVYASVYLPFRAWAVGMPDAYEAAGAFAVLLTVLVLAGAVALIKLSLPRIHPDGPTP